MCTPKQKRAAQREMDAYDSLPACIKQVFDQAPRKTSVYNTMRLAGMRRYRATHGDAAFAEVLETHLAQQTAQEAVVSV